MVWAFILLIIILTIVVISYPLFWEKLKIYSIPQKTDNYFNNADSLLSALSDLEEDFLFERIPNSEYEQQKILLQRSYLELKKGIESK